MSKICLVSDNHGNYAVLKKILADVPDADYYLLLGDSQMSKDAIKPFVSVRGNCDFDAFPEEKILTIGDHRIYMCHGHRFLRMHRDDLSLLRYKALEENCDVVFYGHTHIFSDQDVDGIRFINPGSCARSRIGKESYAIINIDEKIEVFKIEI